MARSRRAFIGGSAVVVAGILWYLLGDQSGSDSSNQTQGAWPQAHYDTQNTGWVDDTSGPATTPEISWSESFTEGIITEPVVSDGVVYVGDAGGNIEAFDADTGEQNWFTSERGSESTGILGIVVGSAKLFVTTTAPDTAVSAFTIEGDDDWTYEAEGECTAGPAFGDGNIYAGTETGNLIAIDAEGGEEQWTFDTTDAVASTPTVTNGTVYAASNGGTLYAVDSSDGSEIWQTEITSGTVGAAAPAVAADSVVVSMEGSVGTFDVESGEELWNVSQPQRDTSYYYEIHEDSSPTVYDGTVYVGSESGNVQALSLETGELEWDQNTGAPNPVSGSPAVTEDHVFAGTDNETVVGFDRSTGEFIWELRLQRNDHVRSSVVVADGKLFVATANPAGGSGRMHVLE